MFGWRGDEDEDVVLEDEIMPPWLLLGRPLWRLFILMFMLMGEWEIILVLWEIMGDTMAGYSGVLTMLLLLCSVLCRITLTVAGEIAGMLAIWADEGCETWDMNIDQMINDDRV